MIHQPKPLLVARTLYNYSKYLLGSRPRLRYVDIIMDYACNLKCEHCSCETLKNPSRKKLTPQDWGNVAGQCGKLGTIIFGVQGGEPLVYPKIEDVIRNLDPKKNFISLKTNGTIASRELFQKLRKWGVDSVTVGLGPIPNEFEFENYNAISRKLKNAFATSLESIKIIAEVGIKPMMSVVISRENIGSKVFQSIIELAKEYNSVLNCALAVPIGSWETNHELMLISDDRNQLDEIFRNNPHVRTDFDSNWLITGCGACKEKLYISPYGDVLPCPFIHISFGNVLEEPVQNIWRRACKTNTFSEYAPVCLAAEDRKFLSYIEIAAKKNVKLPIRFDDPEVAELLSTTHAARLTSQNESFAHGENKK
jgi:MoaA/NifB/PqqE/SkfB family radical SAM enzyme